MGRPLYELCRKLEEGCKRRKERTKKKKTTTAKSTLPIESRRGRNLTQEISTQVLVSPCADGEQEGSPSPKRLSFVHAQKEASTLQAEHLVSNTKSHKFYSDKFQVMAMIALLCEDAHQHLTRDGR